MTTEEIKKELEKKFVQIASANELFGLTSADSGKEFSSLFATNGVIATIIYVVAVVISLRTQLFAKWKEEVKGLYESSRYGTWSWWIETAKRWQVGYSTVVIDGEVGYEKIDENAKIIKAAMVRQNGRSIAVYVAKMENNRLVALNEKKEELSSFQQYLNNVKPLGVYVVAVSKEADKVKIEADIVYNGELSKEAMDKAVSERLNEYFTNLEFGATIYKAQIIEEIMSIEGVVDVALEVSVVSSGVERVLERSIALEAGYGELVDPVLRYTIDNSVRR
jgi:hypothetical protein